jgi:signal peptidase I
MVSVMIGLCNALGMNDDVFITTEQVMAEKQITVPLVMVSTPYDSVQKMRRSRFPGFDRFALVRLGQQLGVVLMIALLCIASYALISRYFVKSVKVVGSSMVPTLQEGGQYLLDRWTLCTREPRRNDIVVLQDPGYHGLAVKRIVAVSGESIHFRDGAVYVNGKKLDEPYLEPHTRTFIYASAREQFITCGKDQYYVLGDNRERSIDSRTYGPVSRGDLLGLIKK